MAKMVLVRTYSAGVHIGELVSREGKEVTLRQSRRIWSWQGANTLNEIALRGVSSGSRVSEKAPGENVLTEAIEILDMSAAAVERFGAQGWGQ